MSGTYATDRQWSDQFLDAIRVLIGPRLLAITPDDIDRNQAADLMVYSVRPLTIACRVRRARFADLYPFDFTVRESRPGGAQTEMDKLIAGWGDWLFYGYAHPSIRGDLCRWALIDLHAFREALIRSAHPLGVVRVNPDGVGFRVFDVRHFPRSMVVDSNHGYWAGVRLSLAAQ